MRLRIAVPLILVATACVTAFATCSNAGAANADGTPAALTLTTERVAADSARVIARWQAACDAKGCADAYAITWETGAVVLRSSRVTGLADSLVAILPAFGDSLLLRFSITTSRRNRTGPTKVVGFWLRNEDATPPGVDSVKVDTLRYSVDSMPIAVYTSTGVLLPDSAISVVERDSVLFVARAFVKAGMQRDWRDTVAWGIELPASPAIAASVALRPPSPRWHDSVWMVALDCGCKESGDPANRPAYNFASGRYQVRTSGGGWRDVTPLSVDPFRDIGTR